jgi:glycerophosphoryl diester phosphodiesterase
LVDIVSGQKFVERAGVSCFELSPLTSVRREEPRMPVGMILSAVRGDMTRLPVQFLSLNQRLVDGELVRRAHARGLEVHVWTVNDREAALRLLDLGCDNLITSDPVLMREVVDWYAGLGDAERVLLRLRRWMRE